MARFRLRYRSTDLELPPGDFVIGRSSECSLAVDDPLVSRRHARLRVSASAVVAEDLGSRNGIVVNGERVMGAVALEHLDAIHVGSQELVLLEVGHRDRDKRPTSVMIVCRSCHLPITPGEPRCAHCGHPVGVDPAVQPTLDVPLPPVASPPEASLLDTAPASPFRLLAGIAEKALALGRPEDAERILSAQLQDLLQRAQAAPGRTLPSADEAVGYALRLAELTAKPRWVDWVFQLHTATGALLHAETIDTLYALVRKVKHPGSRALTEYVAAMQAKSDLFNAREKFLLQRLVGLERVVGA